jgi:chorismate mutase
MAGIENFIKTVENEVAVAFESGIFPPDPDRERRVQERLSKKFPESGIDPQREQSIVRHARLALNAQNN